MLLARLALRERSVRHLLKRALPCTMVMHMHMHMPAVHDGQVRLAECAPKAATTPSGGNANLLYCRDGFDPLADDSEDEEADAAVAPVLASKLQEWFGTTETPYVGPPSCTLPVRPL